MDASVTASDGGGDAASGADALAAALHSSSKGERIARLRSSMDRMIATENARRMRPSVEASEAAEALGRFERTPLPGAAEESDHGPLHVVRTVLEPHHHHGRVPVARALEISSTVMARLALDPALEAVDPASALFLDTETTGLAGGTGTVPFLIGMAYFEDACLTVEQLFLRRFGEEAPLLSRLAERIEAASCVVTYNGKSFDWPLLRARYVMNRLPAPALPPHLDLLHCARRLYRGRLPSVRLVEMEANVLGFVREHDIDGSEIPGVYLHFLRHGAHPRIGAIVEHNGHDLVALGALLGELCRRYAEETTSDDPDEHLAYARVAERAGDRERALRFAELVADGGGEREHTAQAHLLRARYARRERDWYQERCYLEAALAEYEGDEQASSLIHLALSKVFEHRLRDLDRALHHAWGTEHAEGAEASEKRRRRIARRRARVRD